MAPEQLEGKEADSRTDIFAFGATVYEMATGKKAFEGKSQASLIAAIMGQEPRPMSDLQPMTPALLGQVVKKCLEKEPDERWQSASDLMTGLSWVRDGAGAGTVSGKSVHEQPRKGLAWSLVVVLVFLLVGVLAVWYSGTTTVENNEIVRFSVGPSEGFALATGQNGPSPSTSPDGQWLAFRAVSEGVAVLTVRSLDSLATRTLPGTEGVVTWFWSPDSQSVGFFAEGKLKTTDVAGGLPRTVGSIESILFGGTWNSDGVILFGTNDGIYQVSTTGGDLTPVTQVDRSQSELRHTHPSFLPDGIHFLYLVLSTPQEDSGVFIGSMDSEERKFLMNSSSGAQYASGHLLFIRGGSLMAQEFDATRMELSGKPNRVAEGVYYNAFGGAGAFAASENEVLAYFGGGVTEWGIRGGSQLAWVDRQGYQLESIGDIAAYAQIALSPDEGRLVAEVMTEEGTFDLWLLDLERQGISSRITFTSTNERDPVWSPDGHEIAFSWNPNGLADLYRMTLGQDTEAVLLAGSEEVRLIPEDWSRDGRFISYHANDRELRVFPLADGEEPFAVVQGAFAMDEPHFSPDGGWIAYESRESGETEVYVQPFQKEGEKIRISTGGGVQPRWRGDGKELFYLAADGTMMGVQMSPGTTMQAGIPKALFPTSVNYQQGLDQYAVASDGQRFLIVTPMASPESGEITVVLNWTAELEQ
jgi:Tol biopolymer transport system component